MKRNLIKVYQLVIAVLMVNMYANDALAQTTSYGTGAGTGGTNNSNFGANAGAVTSPGANGNTFIGANSGKNNTTGNWNTFLGQGSGGSNTSGNFNVAIGQVASQLNMESSYNVSVGVRSGSNHKTGDRNVFVGFQSASSHDSGEKNTFLGGWAGNTNVNGSGNVFVGYAAGANELGSNKLYLSNSSTGTPLIYGEFDNSKLVVNGKMGVATNTFPTTVGGADISAYQLFVKGGILTEEVRVRTGWADYVFQKDYALKPLADVEKYIAEEGHLPNVPSAKMIEAEGVNVGDIIKIQQEKIEELTLYIIEQNKRLEKQGKEIEQIKAMMVQATEK